MGTWGQKTFANDAALDWLGDLEESAKDGRFLVTWLNYVVKAKNDAAMDEWQEALGAAEVVAASRFEASTHVPKKVYKWINRVGYFASEEDLQLAAQAVQKIQRSPSLREEMKQAKHLTKWDSNLKALLGRVEEAFSKPLIKRAQEKIKRKSKTLAELVFQWGRTPTDALRRRIQKEIALLKNVNNPIRGKGLNPLTPAHWLASGGLLEELKSIFERGADINAKLTMLAPPVSFAVKGGHWPTVKYLLEKGADKERAVIAAVRADRAEILDKLLALGAKLPMPSSVDAPFEETLVHMAVETKGIKVLKMLIDLGFELNCKSIGGFTPLHYALVHSNFGAAKLLLANGANTALKESRGLTAHDLAIKWKLSKFQRLLKPVSS